MALGISDMSTLHNYVIFPFYFKNKCCVKLNQKLLYLWLQIKHLKCILRTTGGYQVETFGATTITTSALTIQTNKKNVSASRLSQNIDRIFWELYQV